MKIKANFKILRMYCPRCRKPQPVEKDNYVPYGTNVIHTDYTCAICNAIIKQEKRKIRHINQSDTIEV